MEVGNGALDKVELGEETPGLVQWLYMEWRWGVSGGQEVFVDCLQLSTAQSWHSFWLVQFSEIMKHLLKTGSVVFTHTLTYNQMFYFGSIIFSSKCFEKKNVIDTPKLIQ